MTHHFSGSRNLTGFSEEELFSKSYRQQKTFLFLALFTIGFFVGTIVRDGINWNGCGVLLFLFCRLLQLTVVNSGKTGFRLHSS